jgi:small subunit ribosomal protein S4
MTKRLESKYKICRRFGVNLWGRPKSPTNRREYGPGQHGQRRKKPTNFGIQLMAKQRLKGYYANMSERQFRRTYEEASRRRGDTIENLIGLLESRLDTLIYRMKFVPTMWAARQFINHGHVSVNGKRITIPSFSASEGDVIEVRERLRQLPLVLEAAQSVEREVPNYLEVDHKAMRGTYVRRPQFGDVPYPVQMEPHMVVEFYSK